MTLGEFIKNRRKELDMSRNLLAMNSGISHTEVHRIETDERKQPSLRVLCALADALYLPQEEMLKASGYNQSDNRSEVERAFPGLADPKQCETVKRVADLLLLNPNLNEEDLDDLILQLEIFIEFTSRKKSSE